MSDNLDASIINRVQPEETVLQRKLRVDAETAEEVARLLRERNLLMEEIDFRQKRIGEIVPQLKALGHVQKRGPKRPVEGSPADTGQGESSATV